MLYRTVLCGSRWSYDASILPLWGHSKHSLTYGIHRWVIKLEENPPQIIGQFILIATHFSKATSANTQSWFLSHNLPSRHQHHLTPQTFMSCNSIDGDLNVSIAAGNIFFLYKFAIPCISILFYFVLSAGSSWRIHLSEITRDRLVKAGGYLLEPRGPIEIKGKGLMNTYWLLGKKGFDKDLPNPPPIGWVEIIDKYGFGKPIVVLLEINNLRAYHFLGNWMIRFCIYIIILK